MPPTSFRHLLPPRIFILAGLTLTTGCGDSVSTVPPQKSDVVSTEPASNRDQVISEEMRKHLWDIEHLGFVLEATVFPKLKATLNDGSLDYWSQLLSDECVCVIPSVSPGSTEGATVVAGGMARFQSTVLEPTQQVATNKPGFLQWLEAVRKQFTQCSTSMGLVRLVPQDEADSQFWTTVWRLRIAGLSDQGPIEAEFDIELSLGELNDDIAAQSSWGTTVSVASQQRMTAQQHFFTEITEASGLLRPERHDNWTAGNFVANTGGVYVSDYDQDGNLDVFVDDHADGNRLYRGLGDGTFEETTEAAGIDSGGAARAWALSCWADLDNDGDDDLIVEDRLYENLGDGKFADVTSETNLPLTPATSYAVADYDLDGLLDLYVCHAGAYRVGQQKKTRVKWIDDGLGIDNVLLKNCGGWQFEDVTRATNTGAGGSSCFTAIWLHANNDNRPDLFAINEFGVNALLLNSADGPFESTDVDAVFGGFSMGAAAGDYNNDGHTDIYVANMYSKAGNRILANVDQSRYPADLYRKIVEGTRGSKLYSWHSEATYEVVPEREMFANVGWAYGPTFTDLDNDGWLDLYATAGFKSEERGKPDG